MTNPQKLNNVIFYYGKITLKAWYNKRNSLRETFICKISTFSTKLRFHMFASLDAPWLVPHTCTRKNGVDIEWIMGKFFSSNDTNSIFNCHWFPLSASSACPTLFPESYCQCFLDIAAELKIQLHNIVPFREYRKAKSV